MEVRKSFSVSPLLLLVLLMAAYNCECKESTIADTDVSEVLADIVTDGNCFESVAVPGKTLRLHYRGYVEDAKTWFDSSFDRGAPVTFTLGVGEGIKGWDEGLVGMCPGELRRLIIPPHFAYGDEGVENVIPPGSTLRFDIHLLEVL